MLQSLIGKNNDRSGPDRVGTFIGYGISYEDPERHGISLRVLGGHNAGFEHIENDIALEIVLVRNILGHGVWKKAGGIALLHIHAVLGDIFSGAEAHNDLNAHPSVGDLAVVDLARTNGFKCNLRNSRKGSVLSAGQ